MIVFKKKANSANGHFGKPRSHPLDGFYPEDIEPLAHDSSYCFAQQHMTHVHLQYFSSLSVFLRKVAAITEPCESRCQLINLIRVHGGKNSSKIFCKISGEYKMHQPSFHPFSWPKGILVSLAAFWKHFFISTGQTRTADLTLVKAYK